MAHHDQDDDLQYQAAHDRATREKAHMILAACKAGQPVNTEEMIENLGAYLGDDQALAELIQQTLAGRNAFRELLDKIALDTGAKQADLELAEQAKYNREVSIGDRCHRYLDRVAA